MPTVKGGLIWRDQIIQEGRGKKEKFRASVPQLAGYEPPDALRPFKHLPRIGFDTETWDPELTTKGPGAHRVDQNGKGIGYICGTAIAYGPDDAEYYPVAHAHKNMSNPDKFWGQLKEEAEQFEGELVGANLQYDLDWMWRRHGVVFPKAKLRDVQTAEPLLDENKLSYKLELLANEYLGEGEGKQSGYLRDLYGEDYISHMNMIDAGHASVYAKADTTSPWKVLDEQYKGLESQGLVELFHLESRLTPLLVKMRQVGVPVDLDVAEQAWEMTKKEAERCKDDIRSLVGFSVDAWSADSIARAFDKESIEYPRSPTGKPSFRKAWLQAHPSKLAQLIVDQRGFEKIGGTFIHNYILEGAIRHGDEYRIHCMFNQLRSDEYGTVSGRFSSSFPNLQNIPTRHPILGPLCRSIFIPERGMLWGSADWSQIEYRFLVHYAALLKALGADKAVRMYHENRNTDFHEMAANITGKPRSQAKNINFGVVYGMGVPTMAVNLGTTNEEAEQVLNEFHGEMPFMKSTYDTASARAATAGEIKTILGRKRRFTDWELSWYVNGKKVQRIFKSLEAAHEARDEMIRKGVTPKTPRRAFTHKALNSLLQGSAADLMKKAMVEMYEGGIFDVLVPHLTIHDEMNSSVPQTKEGKEAFAELVNVMENSMQLQVPVIADAKTGANWSEAH